MLFNHKRMDTDCEDFKASLAVARVVIDESVTKERPPSEPPKNRL